MTDDAIPAGFVLVPRELTHAMLDATCDTQADDAAMRDRWAALLDAAPKITPAPSIVSGSDERAREVSATLLGEVMQDAWGEICDDADAHPSDMKHGKGTVLFYSPGHWTDLIALRLNERLAALAASRPTDAGAGLLEKLDAIKQAARYVPIGDGYFDLYANAAEAVDAAVDRLAATLATPKPPVDEAMREEDLLEQAVTHLVSVLAADGGPRGDAAYKAAREWWTAYDRNLTGDGAGA